MRGSWWDSVILQGLDRDTVWFAACALLLSYQLPSRLPCNQRQATRGSYTDIALLSKIQVNGKGFLSIAIYIKHLINVGWLKITSINVVLSSKLPVLKQIFHNYHALPCILFKEAQSLQVGVAAHTHNLCNSSNQIFFTHFWSKVSENNHYK